MIWKCIIFQGFSTVIMKNIAAPGIYIIRILPISAKNTTARPQPMSALKFQGPGYLRLETWNLKLINGFQF